MRRWIGRIVLFTVAFIVGAQLGMKQERDNQPLCICDESRDYAAGYLDAWTKALEAQDNLRAAAFGEGYATAMIQAIAIADSLAKQTGGPR